MHVLIKDTDTDKLQGHICLERGTYPAIIIASTEEAAAALGRIADAMGIGEVVLLHYPSDQVPAEEDGWRLTDVTVYARKTSLR